MLRAQALLKVPIVHADRDGRGLKLATHIAQERDRLAWFPSSVGLREPRDAFRAPGRATHPHQHLDCVSALTGAMRAGRMKEIQGSRQGAGRFRRFCEKMLNNAHQRTVQARIEELLQLNRTIDLDERMPAKTTARQQRYYLLIAMREGRATPMSSRTSLPVRVLPHI